MDAYLSNNVTISTKAIRSKCKPLKKNLKCVKDKPNLGQYSKKIPSTKNTSFCLNHQELEKSKKLNLFMTNEFLRTQAKSKK